MFSQRDVQYVLRAHTESPKKPRNAVRLADGKTPYYVHPLWCATTLLTEVSLPEIFRYEGATALLYHDVLEDTTAGLPDWLSERVVRMVHDLTFPGPSTVEMEQIWARSSEIRLLKLYDKLSNLLDGSWMSKEKRAQYSQYVEQLFTDVVKHYGELNITRLARGYLYASRLG